MAPYFPLFVDLTGRRALIVGAGRIAARRAGVLAQFCDGIAVVAPRVHPDIEALAAAGRLRLARRPWEEADLDGAALVLACTDDPALNARVAALCRARGVPVNACSDRTLCDFYFPGVAVAGPVVAGVTAGGGDHKLAREATERVRRCLAALDAEGREEQRP